MVVNFFYSSVVFLEVESCLYLKARSGILQNWILQRSLKNTIIRQNYGVILAFFLFFVDRVAEFADKLNIV